MLVRITEKCRMNCSHCMINAGPAGENMTLDTFKNVLVFVEKTGFPLIMLSGGEPMENPDVLTMLQMSIDAGLKTSLLSNGMFLSDPALTKTVLDMDVLIQITNDPRFYPERVPRIEHEKISYEEHIRMVSPFGRAITNKLSTDRQSPLCFNLRSLVRHHRDFFQGISTLRSKMKMCTPSINIDGSISAGESNSCRKIGMVTDSNLVLTNKTCSMTCNKCGLVYNLEPAYKHAIGEIF